jgi:menaquinone-dependent protoporphyrinogen oxidase
VTRHAAELATRPVWLYSSGPIPRPEAKADYSLDRREGDEIANTIRAREHRLFFGKLDRKRLSLIERGPVRMAKLPDGDFRPCITVAVFRSVAALPLSVMWCSLAAGYMLSPPSGRRL